MADTTGWTRERILEARAIWAKAWAEGATAMHYRRGIVIDADAKLTAREEFPLPQVPRRIVRDAVEFVAIDRRHVRATFLPGHRKPGEFQRHHIDAMLDLLDNPYEEDE